MIDVRVCPHDDGKNGIGSLKIVISQIWYVYPSVHAFSTVYFVLGHR